jgi:hypothetical protein
MGMAGNQFYAPARAVSLGRKGVFSVIFRRRQARWRERQSLPGESADNSENSDFSGRKE